MLTCSLSSCENLVDDELVIPYGLCKQLCSAANGGVDLSQE